MTTLLARHLVVLSLEPWDGVWRRNQHLVSQLLEQGLVERVTFVEPAGRGRATRSTPHPGVTALRPRLRLPRRAGGLRLVAAELRAGPLRGADLLWVNDAPLGRWVAGHGVRGFHDVTDDWRETVNTPRVRDRLVAAEDWLALAIPTVVCSDVLAQRWHERYGVRAHVVPNGVDLDGFRHARRLVLDGPGPHVGYVGTLHAERLDVPLVAELARTPGIGTVHLVGPDALDDASRAELDAAGVVRHGPVDHTEVPSWMTSLDVLVCPHLITPFTLSLDAIKAREYLAAGRPVVATPTSGFQSLTDAGTSVVGRSAFAGAVVRAAAAPPAPASHIPTGWRDRALQLSAAVSRT
ncbi:glycosyltransferase [Rhodococcus antarcticus]|uniref:Glycosyltransferase n=1 Tax=Rhodococcus antarcticus TaxID=2987751 RepID=A0ABY6P1E9_9NOCA|nr:glycosyltransferase [Rhodococcus antarcticus]UZJ24968.1 glycosyltransferase [Rhodococcus antarcticus]